MSFKIVACDLKTGARAGILKTAHGEVRTPAFMPVATKGSVKSVSPEELGRIGAEAIISNALHLHMRPGEKNLEDAGGLHKFMRWDGTIFADSGGFQIIREALNIRITEEGLYFRDYHNGDQHLYTPELCMDVNQALGSDIAMLLDDCPMYDASLERICQAAERTVRWARRGIEQGRKLGLPKIFAITQGGTNFELRKWCTEKLLDLKPDGFGIGGLSIGEPKPQMMKILDETMRLLPQDSPRYLMGVGSVNEILDSIALGVDVFDSVFPTQCGRHGTVFVKEGRYNMKGQKLESDHRPLEEGCKCMVCKTFTRSYVNHLLRESELLGMRLVSIHNLYFLLDLVCQARAAILDGTFEEFRKERSLKDLETVRV